MMPMPKDADYLMPIDVVYDKVKEGPVFKFMIGQNLNDPGISEQMKAIWDGYAEYPD